MSCYGFRMRALIILCAILLTSTQTWAAVDDDLPDAIWEGVKRFIPDRKHAVLVWRTPDRAEVDGPVAPVSERLSSWPVYECVKTFVGWMCQYNRHDLHIEANGKQHRIRPENVDNADVVRIADYLYSPCFAKQWQGLGSPNRWRTYGNPMSSIRQLPNGDFVVSAPATARGMTFLIRAATSSADGCEFQLIGATSWIA
jgi:hypothetical protein